MITPLTAPSQAEVNRDYVQWMDMLLITLRPLLLMPLAELANAVERAETLGPLLEPTAYMRGGADNLMAQRRIIDAALALQRALMPS